MGNLIKWIKLILAKFSAKIRNWFDSLLLNSHNHFIYYLPAKIGYLSSLVLRLFYSGIRSDKEQTSILSDLKEKGIVIYATKYKSNFEYLFYYSRYKNLGLPFPEIGFDYKILLWQPVSHLLKILLFYFDYFYRFRSVPNAYTSGYIKQELMNGKSGLLSLIAEKGFYRRFVKAKTDPIKYLIEMQQSIECPIYIVPQLMFYSKNPHRSQLNLIDILFGTEENPGRIRRMISIFKSPGTMFIEVSDQINLKTFINLPENLNRNTEQLALHLRRQLIHQLNRHRQTTTGPILKSRVELKESILTNDNLQKFMVQHAKEADIPLNQVYKKAERYLEEIAAKYSMGMIKIFDFAVRWITNNMFEGFTANQEMLAKIKNMHQKGPLILMPCHKSHIDYLLISYIMFHCNMPCPHIAAGKNLSFWPMGPIFRGAGAFFIRRTFKGKELYARVFKEYIYKLLEEGFNIEFFMEGGRSRTGKLLSPKMGMLSMVLDSYKNGACKNLMLVPIYIGYDRVMEESSYIREIEGGQKKAESLSQMIKARKLIKKRYGKIYVNFDEPITIDEFLSQKNLSLKGMSSQEYNQFCSDIGMRVLNAIDKLTVLTPHALVASAILNHPQKRFSYENLMADIETYMNYLVSNEVKLADTLATDYVNAVEHVLDAYVNSKLIESSSWEKEKRSPNSQFKINDNKRMVLDYYKNNGIAAFISGAFTSLSILVNDAFLFSSADTYDNYSFLQDLFKNEFSQNLDNTSEFLVRKSIKAFINDAIIMPHQTLPNTYNLTSVGFRKLKLFANFLRSYLESYLVVLNYFKRYPADAHDPKNRLDKIQSIGQRMYKRKEIELKESLSKINFKNAESFFQNNGISGSDNNEKIEFYANAIQKYLNCLQ